MTGCSKCGSAAINPFMHGRDPAVDLHLCDVCYWRERAEDRAHEIEGMDSDIADLEAEVRDKNSSIEELEERIWAKEDEIISLRDQIADLEGT